MKWTYLQRPDLRGFPEDAVYVGTPRFHTSCISVQFPPNCWRSSTNDYTVGIYIHQNNACLFDLVTEMQSLATLVTMIINSVKEHHFAHVLVVFSLVEKRNGNHIHGF